MRRRMPTVWLAILLSFVMIAAACGDDGDSSTPPDEAEVDPDPGEDVDTGSDDEDESPSADPSFEDDDQLTSEGEGADTGDMEPQSGGEITFGLVNDGTGFNTTGAVAPGSIRIITSLNDSLVGVTADGEWAPNLAKDLRPSDDFTVWTIEMRPDVRFHDGEPVDAAAVKANLDAFRASPLVGFVLTDITDVVIVDELSVEVRMRRPWGAFPFALIGQPGWMVSPDTIGANDTFTGTGPFTLVKWTPNEGARVERNEDYWRDGLPYLDAINFRFIPEQTVRLEGLEANNLDGYMSPGDADILDFLDDDEIDVWIGEASSNEHLYIMNTEVAPVDDVRVRRALAYAVDRELIIETFRSGLTDPASGPIHPDSIWYADTGYPDYDPEEAARLIAEYEAEVGEVVLEISSEPNTSFVEVHEVVAEFWRQAGAEVSIKEIALGASAGTAIANDFQIFGWIQFSAVDPDADFVFFHSDGAFLNWSNLQNDKIDDGLDIGRDNADFEARYEGYALFQEGLTEAMPMVWIDHFSGLEAAVARPYLHGIRDGVLPDGRPSIGMIYGSFFSWEDVWIESQG